MWRPHSNLSFGEDDRGVAPLIGFILLFGFFVIALAGYQATLVPQQNAEVEFNHYQVAQDDMTKIRTAIIGARTTGEPRSTTFKLGVEYPSRIITLNPPPATGRLATGEQRNLTIEDQDGGERSFTTFAGVTDEDEVYTQLLTYTPFYNEFRGGAPIRLEYSTIYKNFSETEAGGGIVVQNDNQLLVDAKENGTNETTIVPLQGNYSETGIERVSLEVDPGIRQSKEFEDINVTVPTKLDQSTWEEILAPDLPPEKVDVDEEAEELTIVLDGVWVINYAPVGVDSTPPSGERGSGADGDGDGDDEATEINPASPSDIRLVASEREQPENNWTATFNNTANTTNFTEARVSFYSGKASEVEDIYQTDAGMRDSFPWDIGDDFASLDPAIKIEGNGTETKLTIEFDDVKNTDEFFVITFILETDEQATYFIGDDPEDNQNQNKTAIRHNIGTSQSASLAVDESMN